jgi:thioredoxin 1
MTRSFSLSGQTIGRLSTFMVHKPQNPMNMENFNELIQSDKPVLIDFYAEWCGPCKMMKPRLLDVAEQIGEKAKIVAVDVDKEKELAQRFRIQSVPTLIIFKNGNQLWRQSGMISANALVKLLKDYQ